MAIQNAKFALLRRRLQTGIGIDIGSYLTKIVRFSPQQPGQFECVALPTRAGMPPVKTAAPALAALSAQPAVSDQRKQRAGNSVDFTRWSSQQAESLANRLAVAIGSANLRGARVAATISMAACDFRSFHATNGEKLSRTDIIRSVQEATQDSRSRSLALIPGASGESKTRVLSLPEELPEAIATHLDRRGLFPEFLEALPWTLARALSQLKSSHRVLVGIDWSFGDPTLLATVDGKIDYVRRLNAGNVGRMIDRAIDSFQFSKAEAIRWLERTTLAADHPAAAAVDYESNQWLSDNCRQLAQEINTSIEFIQWRNQGQKVQEIYIVGGGAELPALIDFIQPELSVPLASWHPDGTSGEMVPPVFAMAASLAAHLGGLT